MQALSGLKLKVWKVVKEQAQVFYATAAASKRVNLHHPNYITTPRLSLAFQGTVSTSPPEIFSIRWESFYPSHLNVLKKVALTTQPILLEEGEIENPKH
jgi:hypothetical protein